MPHIVANLKRRLSELLDVTLTGTGWLHWDGSAGTVSTPSAADVGADAAGTAAGLVSAEASTRAGADSAEATARAGVQSNLDTHAGLSTTAHGGIVAGTDPRLSDARTPTAHSHAEADVTSLVTDLAAKAAAADLSTHTGLTTTAHGGLVAETDARLTDPRTPLAHAASHNVGGSDELYAWFGSLSNARVEAFPRLLCSTAGTLTSGTVQYTYFTPQNTLTISNLLICSSTGNGSISLCRIGLYTAAANGDLTLVARTASDTSIIGSNNTLYTKALDTTGGYPASYSLVRGTRYAFGFIVVFTSTAPSVRGLNLIGALTTLLPYLARQQAGQSDLPTGPTVAGTVAAAVTPWLAAT